MIPLLRPLLFLAAGIMAGRYLGFSLWTWLLPLLVLAILVMAFSFKKLNGFRSIGLVGAGLMVVLFFCGAALYQSGKVSPVKEDIQNVSLEIKIDKVLKAQPEHTRALGVILNTDTAVGLPGRRVLLMLKQPSKTILPADKIKAVGNIQPISSAPNPGQFSLKEYYGHKWVHEQIWLSEGSYVIHSPSFTLNPFRYSYLLSMGVRETIQKFVPQRSAPTLQAMFLGIKHDISSDMLSTYQKAGVMHILAVSGMHVGIIYLGLIFALGPLIRRRQFWWWLPVAGIWLFAFITGAGPAVVRAALMLSLVDIGRRSGNAVHTFNLLLFSAFLLLIWQPYLLWDIGFQLSYAAMCGILWFLKPLNSLFWFRHQRIHRHFWQPLALSVSAQLGTFPFVLHYFGIFPWIFPLSNLLTLIPVLLAMWGALVLLLSNLIMPDIFTKKIGHFLDWIIHYGFNLPLQWLADLPHAYFSHIYFTPLQVMFFVAGIIFLAVWMQQFRSGKWLLWALSAWAGALLSGNVSYWLDAERSSPLLLHTRNHGVVMTSVRANEAFLWSDSILMAHPEKAGFDLDGTRQRFCWRNITHLNHQVAMADDTLLLIGGKSVLKLQQPFREWSSFHPVDVDYIILSENTYLDTIRLRQVFPGSTVILDGSLSTRKRNIFRRILDQSGYQYHDTRVDGYLRL
jgi:competence protein ComEC